MRGQSRNIPKLIYYEMKHESRFQTLFIASAVIPAKSSKKIQLRPKEKNVFDQPVTCLYMQPGDMAQRMRYTWYSGSTRTSQIVALKA